MKYKNVLLIVLFVLLGPTLGVISLEYIALVELVGFSGLLSLAFLPLKELVHHQVKLFYPMFAMTALSYANIKDILFSILLFLSAFFIYLMVGF